MELIYGVELNTLMEKNELTIEQSKEIIHRDLKPENLLIQDNKVKLIDFGFGKELDSTNQTATHVGTPLYAPPEIFMSGHYDGKKVDIWSVGILTFQLLLGHFPFGNISNVKELKQEIEKESYKQDEAFLSLSNNEKELISGMLEKNPDKRFTTEECIECIEIKRKLSGDVVLPDAKRSFE